MNKAEVNLRVHDFIKTYISASGLSMSELGRRCGVNRATVSRWLKTGSISRTNLLTLCKVLEISQETFFEVIEQPEETSSFSKKKKVLITKIESLREEDGAVVDVIEKILS